MNPVQNPKPNHPKEKAVLRAKAITVSYTSFLLEVAWSEEMLMAYAAVLPCQRLYDWLFSTIKETEHISEDNPYKKFIMQNLASEVKFSTFFVLCL